MQPLCSTALCQTLMDELRQRKNKRKKNKGRPFQLVLINDLISGEKKFVKASEECILKNGML